MKKINFYLYLFSIFLLCFLFSCKSDDPEPSSSEENTEKLTILVYAVNDNDLNPYFNADLAEIKEGLKNVDLNNYCVLVYDAGYAKDNSGNIVRPAERGNPVLWEFVKKGNDITKVALKEYDTSFSSVSVERMSEVIRDMQELKEADSYGLILWSHAMGWTPYIKHITKGDKKYFGDDLGEKMNIDELERALPDNMFRFIWMDCCYMANIETMYQLRNKTERYIASATETIGDGAPYHLVIPHLMASMPDEVSAARSMFEYYNSMSGPMQSCTIAVFNTAGMNDLANASQALLNESFVPSSTTQGLQIYSRGSHGPFYDFIQYMKQISPDASLPTIQNFESCYNDCVIYKAATSHFLIGYPGSFTIDPDVYSGASCHRLLFDNSQKEQYYMTLDWFKDVYPQ